MTYIPEIKSVGDIARYRAKASPDKPALVLDDRVTSYKTLDGRASQVANALLAEGMKPQRRIGFLGKNSDHYFELFFGAAKANVITVPVNWRLAPPEVLYVVNDAEAEILFVGPDFYGVIDKIAGDLKSVRKIVAMGGPHGNWDTFERWRDRQASSDPKVPVGANDVAIQLYTSGTTGHPKGAQLSNANLFALRPYDDQYDEQWNKWGPDDAAVIASPVFHIGGSGFGVQVLYNGGTGVIMADFDPGKLLEYIEQFRIRKIFLVPAAMQFVLRHPRARQTDYSSLKYILYGASPIPLDLLRECIEVFRCGFVQLYGMTETAGSVTYLPPEDHDVNGNARMRSAGKAFKGIEVAIIDAEGQKLPPGEVGEVAVKSPTNMVGYWHLPEATKKTMGADGWLRTGDAGYMDKDGYVYIHDRVKDMIVSGGENIYPAEVENAIFGHPAVEEVAVIGVPSERWGEEVKAIVVRKAGQTVTPQELIDHARARIAGYKVPKSVDFIDVLPRNPSGKILKRELRKPFWEGRERQVN